MKQNPNGWVPEGSGPAISVADPDDPALADLRVAIAAYTRAWQTSLRGLDCTVRWDGPRVHVDLTGPPIDGWREKALAVRVLDAVRTIGRTYGQVDVAYHVRTRP